MLANILFMAPTIFKVLRSQLMICLPIIPSQIICIHVSLSNKGSLALDFGFISKYKAGIFMNRSKICGRCWTFTKGWFHYLGICSLRIFYVFKSILQWKCIILKPFKKRLVQMHSLKWSLFGIKINNCDLHSWIVEHGDGRQQNQAQGIHFRQEQSLLLHTYQVYFLRFPFNVFDIPLHKFTISHTTSKALFYLNILNIFQKSIPLLQLSHL